VPPSWPSLRLDGPAHAKTRYRHRFRRVPSHRAAAAAARRSARRRCRAPPPHLDRCRFPPPRRLAAARPAPAPPPRRLGRRRAPAPLPAPGPVLDRRRSARAPPGPPPPPAAAAARRRRLAPGADSATAPAPAAAARRRRCRAPPPRRRRDPGRASPPRTPCRPRYAAWTATPAALPGLDVNTTSGEADRENHRKACIRRCHPCGPDVRCEEPMRYSCSPFLAPHVKGNSRLATNMRARRSNALAVATCLLSQSRHPLRKMLHRLWRW
jgi:hypothetical protein